MMLEHMFCQVDDFCQNFVPSWEESLLTNGKPKNKLKCQMSISEIMTIVIWFHQSNFRNFKSFYIGFVLAYYKSAFPTALSYNRFIEQKKQVIVPLYFFMLTLAKSPTGIYFVDSTPIKVCHIKREKQHKVFEGLAKKSKSTMGWYFGFKLHILINSCGEIMAVKLTHATTDDRVPVPDLAHGLIGKLFGDKGYISKALASKLSEQDLQLMTKKRKNMKEEPMDKFDRILLRKRAVVESVIDQLKNISQVEHSRHRSPINFLLNLIAGLVAYGLQPKKPAIDVENSGIIVV